MSRTHRLLTEVSDPEDVAIVNDLLFRLRFHWHLACAWERVSPRTHTGTFSDGNPYVTEYEEARVAYERYRERATS